MVALLVLVTFTCRTGAEEPAIIHVKAGVTERVDTPVRIDLRVSRLGPGLVRGLEGGPRAVTLRELRDGSAASSTVVAQLDVPANESSAGPVSTVRLTFILPGRTAAGTSRRFRIEPEAPRTVKGPWSLSDPRTGSVELRHLDHPVFRYNVAPVSHPDFPAVQSRSAYLHPAYSPSGVLVTADYSKKSHGHHRGFFFAYTKTDFGGGHPDFWNIHRGTAKIVCDRVEETTAGPVLARLVTRHRWEAEGLGTALQERWELEAYDIPDSRFWMFDLTTTQQATQKPLDLPPYRYGGMTYRGADSFYEGPLDVLTSEGLDRVRGDQKPARWVDLTGVAGDGSGRYAGAVILDHPTNLHHPTVVRIHPTKIPFFVFTPAHDVKVTLPTDRPTKFRYRVVIHDGHPDAPLDERLWRDFASPPVATLE